MLRDSAGDALHLHRGAELDFVAALTVGSAGEAGDHAVDLELIRATAVRASMTTSGLALLRRAVRASLPSATTPAATCRHLRAPVNGSLFAARRNGRGRLGTARAGARAPVRRQTGRRDRWLVVRLGASASLSPSRAMLPWRRRDGRRSRVSLAVPPPRPRPRRRPRRRLVVPLVVTASVTGGSQCSSHAGSSARVPALNATASVTDEHAEPREQRQQRRRDVRRDSSHHR